MPLNEESVAILKDDVCTVIYLGYFCLEYIFIYFIPIFCNAWQVWMCISKNQNMHGMLLFIISMVNTRHCINGQSNTHTIQCNVCRGLWNKIRVCVFYLVHAIAQADVCKTHVSTNLHRWYDKCHFMGGMSIWHAEAHAKWYRINFMLMKLS